MGCGSARAPNFGCVRGTKPSFFTFAQENSGVQSLASSEALDVLYRATRPASYRRISMAIEIASDSRAFFVVSDLLLLTNIAK